MQIKSLLQCATRLTAAYKAVNALSEGFLVHCGFAANEGTRQRFEDSSAGLIETQQLDQARHWGSRGATQGPFLHPHACPPRAAHHSNSSGTDPAGAIRCLPAILHQHSSPTHVADKVLGKSRRSYTVASYSCSPGPSTANRPPLGQSDKTRSLSAEYLRDQVAEANSILQTVDILRFRERLVLESETTQRMSMKELMAMCKESGSAQSDEEAGRVCEALAHAGIVLRFGDCVFLRPQDVVEIMMRAVPDLEEEVMARLKELEGELKPLEEQDRKIEMRAFRRTHGVLWAGLGFLVLQWGVFLHFTYSELSWDVVEPVTYFTSQLWAILGYCYFLATKEDFAYRHAHSKMSQNFTVGGEKDHRFDRERYERLLREHSRYQRYLRIPPAEGQ